MIEGVYGILSTALLQSSNMFVSPLIIISIKSVCGSVTKLRIRGEVVSKSMLFFNQNIVW